MGQMKNAYKILVGKPEEKSSIETRRGKKNVRMDLWETGWELELMHLAQDRVQ
jgi:hypothetical protein